MAEVCRGGLGPRVLNSKIRRAVISRAYWLELMRMVYTAQPIRDVLFVAPRGGHELASRLWCEDQASCRGVGGCISAPTSAATRSSDTPLASDDDPERRHATAALRSENTAAKGGIGGKAVVSTRQL